jgi:hypothetical protein
MLAVAANDTEAPLAEVINLAARRELQDDDLVMGVEEGQVDIRSNEHLVHIRGLDFEFFLTPEMARDIAGDLCRLARDAERLDAWASQKRDAK